MMNVDTTTSQNLKWNSEIILDTLQLSFIIWCCLGNLGSKTRNFSTEPFHFTKCDGCLFFPLFSAAEWIVIVLLLPSNCITGTCLQIKTGNLSLDCIEKNFIKMNCLKRRASVLRKPCCYSLFYWFICEQLFVMMKILKSPNCSMYYLIKKSKITFLVFFCCKRKCKKCVLM